MFFLLINKHELSSVLGQHPFSLKLIHLDKIVFSKIIESIRYSMICFVQMVGGLCALLGVFILTLPLPIVVNSFSTIYKNRLALIITGEEKNISSQLLC